MRVKNRMFWGVVVAVCAVSPCGARTWFVGKGAGYDFSRIQSAVTVAREGDTIVVAPGVYEERVEFRGDNITLASTDPNNEQVVQSTMIYSDNDTAITLTGQEDAVCTIRGLNIEGNTRDESGGGIAGMGAKATIIQCVISHCKAANGGGLYDCDGLIKDCLIAQNSTRDAGQGGGLYGCDGQIINCRIEGNSAGGGDRIEAGLGAGLAHCKALIQGCTIKDNFCIGQGGGLFRCSGTITQCVIHHNGAALGAGLYGCSGEISHCTISENAASETGGGLYGCGGWITDCLIKDNQAELWHGGGAVLCENLVRCDIVGNQARGYGGGVYDCNTVANCVIRHNRAEVYPGGGVYQATSAINSLIMGNVSGDEAGACYDVNEINGCTIVGNHAASQGGAVVYREEVGRVTNSIVWDNTSESGSQIVVACDSDEPVVIQYSDIQGGAAGVAVSESSVLAWLDGNLDMDPQFKDPGQRAESGVWQAGDNRLLDMSPCINAGDPNFAGADQNDVDGRARVIDGIVDMGAYEYELVPVLLQSIVVTGPERVVHGRVAQYQATAYYDNRSVANVTDLAQWSVSPDTIATIENGRLQLLPLDEAVQFTVTAIYAEGDLVSDSNLVVRAEPASVPANGTTYHVDTLIGSNSNRGRSRAAAWATIQHAINQVRDGDTILVWPGVYTEAVRFKGKAVTVQSAGDAAVLENPHGLAVSFLHGEGPGSVLKNFVIRGSVSGVFVVTSSPTLANLTVVGNERGIECYNGRPLVTHSILWDNSEVDVLGCVPQFSWLATHAQPGRELMPSLDPLFVAPYRGDYHLMSQAGHWDPEFETWVPDGTTSLCIDAGNWYHAVGHETFPNGGIVNLGAYGGTAYASRSYFGKPVCPVIMAGDINGDCMVDQWDMELLLLHWLEEFDSDAPTGGGR